MTKEEYINQNLNKNPIFMIDNYPQQWSEPKYQCEKCGGNMRKNEAIMLASLPPKCQYKCDKCGNVDYLTF